MKGHFFGDILAVEEPLVEKTWPGPREGLGYHNQCQALGGQEPSPVLAHLTPASGGRLDDL